MRRSASRRAPSLHSEFAELIGRLEAEIRSAGLHALPVAPDTVGEIGNQTGAYLLALHLPRAVDLGTIMRSRESLRRGCYVYAGSAYGPGGLRARLQRHMNPAKTMHWHIDRLTGNAHDMAALAVPDGDECCLVEMLLATRHFAVAVPGFGSSDCRKCAGHLLAAN